ncbi:unnamed protein product, partial [Staurois parvus]
MSCQSAPVLDLYLHTGLIALFSSYHTRYQHFLEISSVSTVHQSYCLKKLFIKIKCHSHLKYIQKQVLPHILSLL